VVRIYQLIGFAMFLATGDAAGQHAPSRTALARGIFAITNVNVLPMTSAAVLHGQTVLVRDGRIARIGPAQSVTVPDGAARTTYAPGIGTGHSRFRVRCGPVLPKSATG
jgi:hypothetical protein